MGPATETAVDKYELFWGNNLEVLPRLPDVKCIFADPPDNIDLGYGEYKDKMPDAEYEELLFKWLHTFVHKAEITWFSFNTIWTPAIGSILHQLKRNSTFEIEIKPCVQVFTFGQHNSRDLGNNHRPLWRIRRDKATLYPLAIRVPSWRQRNGDKRAAEGGRVPGDVFDMQYPGNWEQFITEFSKQPFTVGIQEEAWEQLHDYLHNIHPGDVFDFPRVTGNSKQRCDWHPTQLHEELVQRCLLLSTTDTDRTIDPFAGTGTTMRVARRNNRPCTVIDIDQNYCERIAEANGLQTRGMDMLCRARRWAA